jgi:HK97 gp10 family phage protein
MSVGIEVRGIDSVVAALASLTDKQAKAMLQKSASAGAKVLKGTVKAAAPKGQTGNLRRSIRSGQTKRNRPAARVYNAKKIAFYRHMVVGGTRAHGPRTAKVMIFRPAGEAHNVTATWVRGTKPRPFFAQGFDAGRAAAEAAIDKVVDAALAKL